MTTVRLINDMQFNTGEWINATFGYGSKSGYAIDERCLRFIEEAIELVQSLELPKEQVLAMVDYVYGRPAGEPRQELGGTMMVLAALANAAQLSMELAYNNESKRCWEQKDRIKAKQMTKPLRGEGIA